MDGAKTQRREMEIPRPIITFTGSETQLPLQLKDSIEQELPREALEWQRPYRRQPKTVYLEVKFEHYTDNFNSENQLLEKQLLHTYWIECYDVDNYKQNFRENLIGWVNKFSKLNSSEWLIVLIDNTDKKLNKTKLLMPRSSVADKIKADFPFTGKSSLDRHIVTLIDPLKKEKKDQKSLESFFQFLSKARQLLLSAYSKQLTSYEDFIRSQREKRTNESWDFVSFFLAQEELAFAFELLGLLDEALVQYDELDALFSQFIQNAHLDSLPFWLKNLVDKCDSWHGLYLSNQKVSFQLREKIKESKGSFLELRNYLFARQCELLLLQHMPWQVASRSLPFLRNCVGELKLLNIQLLPGAVDCWVFLSASEILLKCERYNDSSQMDSYSKNTIGVRAYSRRKLEELGKICGLAPGMQTTSDHLHNIISLISGMGPDYHSDTSSPSAQSRLKDALSNTDAFLRNYLEFSELTMGTYKHIGRMREARLIGKELANIYMKLGNYQLALSFLLDLEKIFVSEKWLILLSDIRKMILECYEKQNDKSKQIVYCFYLASNQDLPKNEKEAYFDKLTILRKEMRPEDEPIKIKMDNVFDVKSIRINSQNNKDFITNFDINLYLQLNSNLIKSFTCRRTYMNLQFSQNNQAKNKEIANELKNNELCTELRKTGDLEKPTFESFYDASVGILCKNHQKVLKRFDSQFNQGKDTLIESELSFQYNEPFTLESCVNDLNLKFNTQHNGIYSLDQFCLFAEPNIYFLNNDIKEYSFQIISQEPNLELKITNEYLNYLNDELISGIPQKITVILNAGSNYFPRHTKFDLKSSTGLFIKLIDQEGAIDSNEIANFQLPIELKPFDKFEFKLMAFCEFGEQRSNELITKKLEIFVNDNLKLNCPLLHFSPPFYSTMTLHTCAMKKFIQISLISNSLLKFDLQKPMLECVFGDEQNSTSSQLKCNYLTEKSTNSIQNEQIVHLMWEIMLDDEQIVNNFKLRFSLNYELDIMNHRKSRIEENDTIEEENEENSEINHVNGDHEMNSSEQLKVSNLYKCDFILREFTTLYTVRISVNPQTNSEFIRAGNLCSLNVKIKRNLSINLEKTAIMYELVSDRTLWAINGKTAGVLENIDNEHELNFEVLPLISGFIPLPSIRLSKYIKQDQQDMLKTPINNLQNSNVKLVAFDSGQIYNYSRGIQVNVLQSSGLILTD